MTVWGELMHGRAGVAAALAMSSVGVVSAASVGWPMYGGDARQDHYSSLRQIDRTNVKRLTQVWRFDSVERGDSETNPLVIGRNLYAYTPEFKVISLDGATGSLLWKFDSGIHGSGPQWGLECWTDGAEQLLFASVMYRLYALDPATGKPIETFGDHGYID